MEALFSTLSTERQASMLGMLCLALLLSSLIGLEREIRMKSAGLRTNTLVGVSSCLIMLISKFGFMDVLRAYEITLDPSRVAAQIISGIGFIGGGLIFVQRDVVRGLTTAATIWLTAAVGMACGAGLPLLALFVTAAHFIVVYAYAPFVHRFLSGQVELEVVLAPGQGILHQVLDVCRGEGYAVDGVQSVPDDPHKVELMLSGGRRPQILLAALRDLDGVTAAIVRPHAQGRQTDRVL